MSRKGDSSAKQGGTNPTNRDVNASTRATQAIALRSKKLPYAQIASQCGYADASSCRKAILRELDRCVVKNVEHLRMEELDSLERLEKVCWERLEDTTYSKAQLFAVDRILAIKERRSRLMGMDVTKDATMAATQVIIREYGADVEAV